jgi:hypothetical protein
MTYTDLRANIAAFLNRDDLTAIIPTFVTLAEAQINRDVRHWRMEKTTVLTFTTGTEDLPADWLETIRLQMDDKPMELASREEIARWQRSNEVHRPRFFAHIAGKIEVWPAPDSSYPADLLYMARTPALSDAAPVNWLLTEAPDVYLYGSLIQSAPYLIEDDRAAVWGSLYAAAVQNLNLSSDRARFSGPLRLRA